VFRGRHHGFESLPVPAIHERRIELDGRERALRIADTVTSEAEHSLQWTFPLGPGAKVSLPDGGAVADFGAVRLSIAADGVELGVEEGLYSPSYGLMEPRQFVTGRRRSRPGRDVAEFHLRID
jgi:hypothetical protein